MVVEEGDRDGAAFVLLLEVLVIAAYDGSRCRFWCRRARLRRVGPGLGARCARPQKWTEAHRVSPSCTSGGGTTHLRRAWSSDPPNQSATSDASRNVVSRMCGSNAVHMADGCRAGHVSGDPLPALSDVSTRQLWQRIASSLPSYGGYTFTAWLGGLQNVRWEHPVHITRHRVLDGVNVSPNR